MYQGPEHINKIHAFSRNIYFLEQKKMDYV